MYAFLLYNQIFVYWMTIEYFSIYIKFHSRIIFNNMVKSSIQFKLKRQDRTEQDRTGQDRTRKEQGHEHDNI